MSTIRKGEVKDLPAVLDLVHELASFEKEPQAVTTTLADYENAFDQRIFEFLVVEVEQKVVGMALYYMTFSTWKGKMLYLEDFVVKKEFRNLGLGKALFTAFQQEAVKQGAILTKWQVLDWNVDAIRFYEREGAIIEKIWYNCKIIK